MNYSPADIVGEALINANAGSAPGNRTWPIYIAGEPPTPDNCITIYDTTGVKDGRNMLDQEAIIHHGIQVRVRSTDHKTGYNKAESIATVFDSFKLEQVDMGDAIYSLVNVSRQTGVIALGKDTPTSKVSVFTINALTTIKKVS